LCAKGILAQDLGFLWGLLRGFREGFGIEGGEGALSTICRGPAGFFEAYPGTPVPPAPLCLPQIQAIDYWYPSGISERAITIVIKIIHAIIRATLAVSGLARLFHF